MLWWEGKPEERFWVEIRTFPGIGTYLACPPRKQNGAVDAWYELVRNVPTGDVVLHWSVREGRFVGWSCVKKPAQVTLTGKDPGYYVELEGFVPFSDVVGLDTLRAKAGAIYTLRDNLAASYAAPLLLPFQFTQDRSQFRFMSNYFAKMPAEVVDLLFGQPTRRKLGRSVSGASSSSTTSKAAFMAPFKAKADSDYMASIASVQQRRSRAHETLVNECATWLIAKGLEPARNAAIDLGLLSGSLIMEAKIVGNSWPDAIRAAVGQLYEYRYFKISDPGADLVFLSNKAVPDLWVRYLEKDRGIGAMWPRRSGAFVMTPLARRGLGLK
jgi:hypothetical protein